MVLLAVGRTGTGPPREVVVIFFFLFVCLFVAVVWIYFFGEDGEGRVSDAERTDALRRVCICVHLLSFLRFLAACVGGCELLWLCACVWADVCGGVE
jgi:hypothetical protein